MVKHCPYCNPCGCGREAGLFGWSPSLTISSVARRLDVFNAVVELSGYDRAAVDMDPLYLAQELVLGKFFSEDDPPRVDDVGHAQDLIKAVEQ